MAMLRSGLTVSDKVTRVQHKHARLFDTDQAKIAVCNDYVTAF
jgi:hypothetical protein